MIWVLLVVVPLTVWVTVVEYPYVQHWLEERRRRRSK